MLDILEEMEIMETIVYILLLLLFVYTKDCKPKIKVKKRNKVKNSIVIWQEQEKIKRISDIRK